MPANSAASRFLPFAVLCLCLFMIVAHAQGQARAQAADESAPTASAFTLLSSNVFARAAQETAKQDQAKPAPAAADPSKIVPVAADQSKTTPAAPATADQS